jgi:hypothetical protein
MLIQRAGFTVFCCSVLSLQAATVASWNAATHAPSGGISLVRGEQADWEVESAAGRTAARLKPASSYYQRASFLLRVDKPASGRLWLELGYLDRGYGLITVTYGRNPERAVAAADQWNVTRLNTGRVRHAVFAIDNPSFAERAGQADFRIHGVQWLISATVTDTAPEHEPPPDVRPAFTLRDPMELVTTAGADADKPENLQASLSTMRNLLPLAKALGFNGIESYVKWNFVERTPGNWDWSFYDAVVDELERHGLKWFPLLIVGSAYALPKWFFESKDMVGYRCLEHGAEIEIPTIFSDHQVRYVQRFLSEFGKHYGARSSLLGVRLGPSANYGEAQYPATGAWGYANRGLHTHLGYWAGDTYASESFRRWLQARYTGIEKLNSAWQTQYRSFGEVKTFHPVTARTPRMRLDFNNWYMGAMSEWCERWAVWARESMPNVSIYQSSGGWGAVEIGTDYAAQAKSMAALKGGIRLTNENDSYLNNVGATRLAASAARFYGAKLGFEPAGFSSERGVIGRLYNSLTNGANHLFYYHGNLYDSDGAADAWAEQAPLLDWRSAPRSEIAVFYPDTDNRVSDEALRHLRASAFFDRVQPMRSIADFDFVSERMVEDGALDRYKVLVFLWARYTEQSVLDRIASWVRSGGSVIYPERLHMREGGLGTPENDHTVWNQWQRGETGGGRVVFFRGHPEPVHYYMSFLRQTLRDAPELSALTRAAIDMDKPQETYWALLANGRIALLNYDDAPSSVRIGDRSLTIAPYRILMEDAAVLTAKGRQ